MVRTGGSAGERRRPRRAPRGSAAVLAAVTMPVLLMMFTLVIAYGFLVDDRQRLDDATFSLAATLAEQALVLPQQRWLTAPDIGAIAAANGVPSSKFVVESFIPYYMAGPGKFTSQPDAWAPAVLQVGAAYNKPELGLGSLVQSLLGSSGQPLHSIQSARLSQLKLGTFNMARERVVFVLDFSKTMRLHYDGDPTKPTGQEVMQQTGAQVLQYFSDVFNSGILLFSDEKEGQNQAMPLLTATAGNQKPDDSGYKGYVQQLSDTVSKQPTMGNGTDIAKAITTAAQMLTAGQSADDYMYSNKRIVLITDGEPSSGEGITSSDYRTRVQEADLAAERSIRIAWADDIQTQVVFMERTQPDQQVLEDAKAFLGRIAGSKSLNGANSNNYHSDAGDYGAIAQWLQQQAVYPICYSAARIDNGLRYNVPRALLPGSNEPLYAYFDSSQDGSGQERPIANVFWGAANKDAFLAMTQRAGATLPQMNRAFDLTQLDNPDNLVIWYDETTQRVALSPILCAAIFSNQNPERKMSVRLRWGAPRPVQPGREAIENDVIGI